MVARRYSTRKRGLEGEWAGSPARFQAELETARSSAARALPGGMAAITSAAAPGRPRLPDFGDVAVEPCGAPVMVRVAKARNRSPDRFGEGRGPSTKQPLHRQFQGEHARGARLDLGRQRDTPARVRAGHRPGARGTRRPGAARTSRPRCCRRRNSRRRRRRLHPESPATLGSRDMLGDEGQRLGAIPGIGNGVRERATPWPGRSARSG